MSWTLTESEKNDNLENFLAYYDANAISMPEYQPTLQGKNEIAAFYQEIFRRQKIQAFERKADEIIRLDSTIIEIGTFKKEYTDSKTDSLFTENRKYWNVWAMQSNGNFKLKGEVFGFFHPVEKPEALIVHLNKNQTGEHLKFTAKLERTIIFYKSRSGFQLLLTQNYLLKNNIF